MKPDWDTLIEEFDGHDTTLVADVDCTAEGKALCDKAGVRGYPTIKHGDPNDLEDYKGGRDYDALEAFAKGLKPVCSPAKLELCDTEKKAKIEEIQALSDDDLEEKIDDFERQIRRAEAKFKKRTEKLQQKYQEFEKEKEEEITSVKDAGLGLMKSVKAHKEAGRGEL
jgi:hypothetical protein